MRLESCRLDRDKFLFELCQVGLRVHFMSLPDRDDLEHLRQELLLRVAISLRLG